MKDYRTILFDLDGTLTDSGPGITNCVVYALRQMGCPVPEQAVLKKFLGPPLMDSFRDYIGLDPERAAQGVELYLAHYREQGIWENSVYQGIPVLLEDLKAAGKTVLVATSKLETTANRVLKHFDLLPYFDHVVGSLPGGGRPAKADVIACALQIAGVADKRTAVMVGDREHDILGAKAVGLDCIGVLYGYGDRAEHEAAGATAIAPDVAALHRLLLG